MRAALIAVAVAFAAPPAVVGAAAPLQVTERQVLTLDFTLPVQKLAVSDPQTLELRATGSSVRVTGVRAGRVQLEIFLSDGAVAAFDVTVEPLRRPVVRPPAPDEIELAVGQERVLPAPPGAQVLLEETGVVSALQDSRGVVVRGVAPGDGSLVVVDPSGGRTTWKLRVR